MATVDEPHIWKRASLLVSTTLDWCDVTRTNIMRLFHCLWSPIVSVYYEYQVWQGSDCVPGTCVPSKNKHRGWFDLLDDFQYSCCSGGLWEGLWWKGWQLEPSLLRLWSFIFLSGGQMNLKKQLLSIKYTNETTLGGPELFVRGHFWPIDCSCNVYPFIHSISTSNKTVSSYFQPLESSDSSHQKRWCSFRYLFPSSPSSIPQWNFPFMILFVDGAVCVGLAFFCCHWVYGANNLYCFRLFTWLFFFLSKAPPFYSSKSTLVRSPAMDSQSSQKSNHRLSSDCERELGEVQTSFSSPLFHNHLMNLWGHLYAFSFELYNQIDWAGFQ